MHNENVFCNIDTRGRIHKAFATLILVSKQFAALFSYYILNLNLKSETYDRQQSIIFMKAEP